MTLQDLWNETVVNLGHLEVPKDVSAWASDAERIDASQAAVRFFQRLGKEFDPFHKALMAQCGVEGAVTLGTIISEDVAAEFEANANVLEAEMHDNEEERT